jgi:hypothetical protein
MIIPTKILSIRAELVPFIFFHWTNTSQGTVIVPSKLGRGGRKN